MGDMDCSHVYEDILKKRSFAYKVVYVENGLIILFDKLKRFHEKDIGVKMASRDLLVELGNNVFLLTEDMMKHLLKTGNIFLYEGERDGYETKRLGSAFTASAEVLARIQGAWDVLKERSGQLNQCSSGS